MHPVARILAAATAPTTAAQLAVATCHLPGFPLVALDALPPDEQLRFWFWFRAVVVLRGDPKAVPS